jgi:hypothetical protein
VDVAPAAAEVVEVEVVAAEAVRDGVVEVVAGVARRVAAGERVHCECLL